MPEVTRIMIATHQHAGLDGAPGDAHDWDDGGAHGDQGHDCSDAARGDAHDRDDVDAQGDQGLQKQWMVRAQQPIGLGADIERFPGTACSDHGRFPGSWFGGRCVEDSARTSIRMSTIAWFLYFARAG